MATRWFKWDLLPANFYDLFWELMERAAHIRRLKHWRLLPTPEIVELRHTSDGQRWAKGNLVFKSRPLWYRNRARMFRTILWRNYSSILITKQPSRITYETGQMSIIFWLQIKEHLPRNFLAFPQQKPLWKWTFSNNFQTPSQLRYQSGPCFANARSFYSFKCNPLIYNTNRINELIKDSFFFLRRSLSFFFFLSFCVFK